MSALSSAHSLPTYSWLKPVSIAECKFAADSRYRVYDAVTWAEDTATLRCDRNAVSEAGIPGGRVRLQLALLAQESWRNAINLGSARAAPSHQKTPPSSLDLLPWLRSCRAFPRPARRQMLDTLSRPLAKSSCFSTSSIPTSRTQAPECGKMPMTRVRRRISRLSRSKGFVDEIRIRCACG